MRTLELGDKRLELVRGDITQESVDAIVNAANAYLAGGGGVDGAIHRAAGPALIEACRAVPPRASGERCPAGEAVLTTAGELPVRAVIHAVGPFWYDGTKGEPEALASAHRRCLELAAIEGFESIAFPAISCGVYGYPVRKAARVALPVIIEHLRGVTSLNLVRYVLFSEIDLGQFAEALESLQDA